MRLLRRDNRAWTAVMMVFVMILSIAGLTASTAVAAHRGPTYTVEVWRSVEIPLTSTATYSDPFGGVQVTATFRGPGGRVLTRPAFWDGGSTWKVRFAPTATGNWSMTTSASNPADSGLNGVAAQVIAVPYHGGLAIYQHGFLKPSADGHYLEHADGTPFFYLGDTHWILPHERLNTSNAPGVASQFKYVVDKRAAQRFTVYQSEPIWQPHGGSHPNADEEPKADLTNGLTSADLAGFAQLDQKFAYIADAGLVHANAMVSWAAQPHDFPAVMTPAYMASVARYWDARYGAYPVIWTVAQEIDNDFYGVYSGTAMAPWTAAIEALDAADAYGQPLMPHQETSTETSVGNSRFAAEPWHDGFAAQLQFTDGWNLGTASAYWNSGKPSLAYETPYEDFWTDSRHALSALYKSYLLGFRGYGYGVSGLWNDVYSAPGEPLDAGTDYELPARYQWWFTGANRQTANQLTYGVGFFRGLDWWKLTPRFGDQLWSDFGSGDNFVASDNNKLYVALFTSAGSGTGTLRQLDPDHYYSAEWFNPRTGQRTTIATGFKATSGRWTAPQRPTAEDWVLSVKMGAPFRNDPDLTVGGSYSASSSWDANQTAVNAFDGKFTTNWQACNGCWAQQWLAVDFQQNKTFNEVAVSEYGNRTTGYRIEYWNGTSWQTAYTGTGGFGQMGETTSVHFPAVTGSKARILYLSGTANAPIVYELSVFNRAGT